MTERRSTPSLLASMQSLLHDLPQMLGTRVTLLSLELRRAMQALALIVGLVLAAAVLLATAWIALWWGVAAALLDAGFARHWIALLVLLLNAGTAGVLLMWARAKAPQLALPATVRSLTVPSHVDTRRMSDATLPTDTADPR